MPEPSKASLKAAREFIRGSAGGEGTVGTVLDVDLACLLDQRAEATREAQHWASVTEVRQAWTRGRYGSFDEAVRAVRDAPPPPLEDEHEQGRQAVARQEHGTD